MFFPGFGSHMSLGQVRALHNFRGDSEAELSFNAGDIINVTSKDDPGWWEVCFRRSRALIVVSGRDQRENRAFPDELHGVVSRRAASSAKATSKTRKHGYVAVFPLCLYIRVRFSRESCIHWRHPGRLQTTAIQTAQIPDWYDSRSVCMLTIVLPQKRRGLLPRLRTKQ